MTSTFEKLQEIIADALYVEKSEAARDASLMKDLGAESIDFLDIIFRVEKEFGIKIPKGEIERKARGNLSDDEFAINGKITGRGLDQLRASLPEANAADLTEGLQVRDIPGLFTVATFENLVLAQLGEVAEEAAPMQAAAASNHGSRL
jgi:acyl carrier protein